MAAATRARSPAAGAVPADPSETIPLWPGGAPGMPTSPPKEVIDERSTDPAHRFAFMIREEDPLCSHFVAMPKELARLNVNAFTAGLVAGMLEAAGFPTQSVQAVTVPAAAAAPAAAAPPPRDGVVYLIVFADAVAARELGA